MRKDQVSIRTPLWLVLAVVACVAVLLAVPLLVKVWAPVIVAEGGKPDVIRGRPIAPSLLHSLKNG